MRLVGVRTRLLSTTFCPFVASACNPCAAGGYKPCGAAEPVELSDAEAQAAYGCFKDVMQSGYAKSGLTSDVGLAIASAYRGWTR